MNNFTESAPKGRVKIKANYPHFVDKGGGDKTLIPKMWIICRFFFNSSLSQFSL